jgi:hypothetical protein
MVSPCDFGEVPRAGPSAARCRSVAVSSPNRRTSPPCHLECPLPGRSRARAPDGSGEGCDSPLGRSRRIVYGPVSPGCPRARRPWPAWSARPAQGPGDLVGIATMAWNPSGEHLGGSNPGTKGKSGNEQASHESPGDRGESRNARLHTIPTRGPEMVPAGRTPAESAPVWSSRHAVGRIRYPRPQCAGLGSARCDGPPQAAITNRYARARARPRRHGHRLPRSGSRRPAGCRIRCCTPTSRDARPGALPA